MSRLSPSDLSLFLCIARHLSFSRAAVELGLSPSAVSHALRGVEERLGLRLFNRSTRSVALTEAGRRLQGRLAPVFQDIDAALDELNTLRDTPSGVLRLNAGRAAIQIALLPLVTRFLAAYPEIAVELHDDDALVDMVSGGFDAGVRFGETLEADMVAAPLGPPQRSIVVASPDFLASHPAPRHPQDLLRLPCIEHRFPSGARYRWEFEQAGNKLQIQVSGRLTLSDVGLMLEAALQGAGLAYVFERMAAPHLAAGTLVQVLDDWCPSYPGLYLYYPNRRLQTAALRTFIDFVKTWQA